MSGQLLEAFKTDAVEGDVEIDVVFEGPQARRPRPWRRLLVRTTIAVVLAIGMATVAVAQWRGGDTPAGLVSANATLSTPPPSAGEVALARDLVAQPLLLVETTPLEIDYRVSELDFEVTDNEGNVLRPAQLLDTGSFRYARLGDGTWSDMQVSPAQVISEGGTSSESSRGLIEMTFDGTTKRVTQGGEAVMAIEADASGVVEPGDVPRNPHSRFELSAYGASFLVDLEQGYNDAAVAQSSVAPTAGAREVPCLVGTCYSIDFEREATEVFFDSLNKDGTLIERGEIVFDPSANLVLEYRTYVNDVMVHEFVVTDVIRADKAA